jgi:hypothetical protein
MSDHDLWQELMLVQIDWMLTNDQPDPPSRLITLWQEAERRFKRRRGSWCTCQECMFHYPQTDQPGL